MSRFLKALEQVERERAARDAARLPSVAPVEAPASPASEEPRPTSGNGTPPERAQSEPRRAATVRAPAASANLDARLVSLVAPVSFEAEQYRTLRYIVEQLRARADLRSIGISSPGTADGKSTTAINLAGALAQAKAARILLIDADLRNPSVARLLGVNGGRGVADFVTDPSVGLDDVVVVPPSINISVVPAGEHDMAPYESLGSPRFGELVDQARKRYDFVIVDTPPLMPMPDTRQVANWVDGMIVVIGAHRTPRRLLEMALATLEPSKIVGLVFNGDDACTPRYYGRYDGIRRSGGSPRRGRRR
jgi:capsular exopolysaccharide synthesis family protein